MSTKSNVQLQQELAAALEVVKALKTQIGRPLRLEKSQKGGVSIYGLQRFPVTLYPNQWKKVFAMSEEIQAFIAKNCPESEEEAA
jgi:hypothetical protein